MDKSLIIDKVNERIHTKNRCLCITKPRRFGKTSVLNMLGAYYGKSYPSSAIFDRLKISHCKSYTVHLNQYNIINLNMNCLPDNGSSYSDYTALIKGTIEDDIEALYPELKRASFRSLPICLPPRRTSLSSLLTNGIIFSVTICIGRITVISLNF